MFDGFVKSGVPIATKSAMGHAALRCILRHCGVPTSTPHSSGFARLRVPTFVGDGAFYEAVNDDREGYRSRLKFQEALEYFSSTRLPTRSSSYWLRHSSTKVIPKVFLNPAHKAGIILSALNLSFRTSLKDIEFDPFSCREPVISIDPCCKNTSGHRRWALPISFWPSTVISCPRVMAKHMGER